MQRTILIAEDDADIIDLLKLYLENEGYLVLSAANGAQALKLIESQRVDLAVLDIMMPEMNGYELTKAIRRFSNMPLIILSAKNTDSDKILGLDLGADDYLAKPFNPLEILARIRSNLRRFYDLNPEQLQTSGALLHVQDLQLNTETFILKKQNREILLTPTEYRILACLMKAPGRIFTKVQLYETVNGAYFESDENTMMVHISKLREKLEDDPKTPRYIKTVRGLGYKIEKG